MRETVTDETHREVTQHLPQCLLGRETRKRNKKNCSSLFTHVQTVAQLDLCSVYKAADHNMSKSKVMH